MEGNHRILGRALSVAVDLITLLWVGVMAAALLEPSLRPKIFDLLVSIIGTTILVSSVYGLLLKYKPNVIRTFLSEENKNESPTGEIVFENRSEIKETTINIEQTEEGDDEDRNERPMPIP